MKKRKGFFDDVSESESTDDILVVKESSFDVNPVDFDTEKREINEEALQDVTDKKTDAYAENDNVTDEKSKARSCACKKRNAIAFSSLAVVIISFVFISIVYGMGLFNDKYSGGDGEENGAPQEEFFFYPADYETDILTVPEYLALDRRIKYAPDTSQSYLLKDGDFAAEGEPGLIVLGQYLNAVIAGDHENVNSLFTEEYLKENKKHERFPPQKLFEIKIRKVKEEIKDAGESVYIFVLSYKIFRNDGLFRNNVDETRTRAQLFEIIVYPDDSGKINLIKDAPGYNLDI